jgi:hypothetical protein
MAQTVRFTDAEQAAIDKIRDPMTFPAWVHDAVKEKLDRANKDPVDLSHETIAKIAQKVAEMQK